MENGLFSEESFASAFGNKVVLFCHITSRVPDREDDGLLRTYGGNAFPTIFYIDASGKLLTKHQGPRTVAGFSQTLSGVEAYAKAKKRVAAGEKGAAADLLFAGMQLGKIGFAEAKVQGVKLRLDKEQKRRFRSLLAGLEFDSVSKPPRFKRGMTREEYLKQYQDGLKKRHKTVLDMVANGRIPGAAKAGTFWIAAAQAADAHGDKELAKKAITKARKHKLSGQAKRFLDRLEAKLEGKEVPAGARRKATKMVPIKKAVPAKRIKPVKKSDK